MRWLTLLATLPPTPTRHRVGVWRKLQRMGAVRLRGSAWILPETPETTELFQWLVQDIESFHGEVTLLHVDRIRNITPAPVTALFPKARPLHSHRPTRGHPDVLRHPPRYPPTPR